MNKNCASCNKSTLSLLLLRPSPVAKQKPLAPVAPSIPSAEAIVDLQGLIPARKPTESNYALRLLREGYVHVYVPHPVAGMRHWMVFRVTKDADLVPEGMEAFHQPGNDLACSRAGEHNMVGMKLLSLPQAHRLGTIWIAYSANLWNDGLRARNAANANVMQQVVLGSCGKHEFKPTADALRKGVLEFSLKSKWYADAIDVDFRFTSLSDRAEDTADQLVRAAACNPKTAGWEKAVVLADPVGIAAELNGLRLRRSQLAIQEIEKPENAHPLNSSNTVLRLQSLLLDSNKKNLDGYAGVCPLKLKAAYDQGHYPPGTEWHPLTPEDYKALRASAETDSVLSPLLAPYRAVFSSNSLGRVVPPDYAERVTAWYEEKTQETWKLLSPYYDEAARAKWVETFEAKLKTEHGDYVERFELDWLSATDDAATLAYFKSSFDPADANDPDAAHSPGLAYSRESHYIHQPAPVSTGPALDQFGKHFDKEIENLESVALRALFGNQQSLIELVHQQLVGDPAAEGDQGGMRDKTYDAIRNALGGAGPELKEHLIKKYSWMQAGLCLFSLGQMSAFTGLLVGIASRHPAVDAKLQQALGKVQYLWGAIQTTDIAVQSALGKKGAKLPVLVSGMVNMDEAFEILRSRAGLSQDTGLSARRLKRMRAQKGPRTRIRLSMLTDTDALNAAKGNIAQLAKSGDGTAMLGGKAGDAANGKAASTAAAAILTEEQFLELYKGNAKAGTAAKTFAHDVMTGAGRTVGDIATSFEGRVALGVLLVQGIGLLNCFRATRTKKEEAELKEAWFGIYDASACLFGGLMELWQTVATARVAAAAIANAGKNLNAKVTNEVAKEAVERSIGIGALRFLVPVAGVASALINVASIKGKLHEAEQKGDSSAKSFYYLASFSFVGLVVVSSVQAVGEIAVTLAARKLGGVFVESLAERIAGEGILVEIGAVSLSIVGVEVLLLAAGIGTLIGGVGCTPLPIQRWLLRSYFGKDPSWINFSGHRDFAYEKGDWKAELEGLQQAIRSGEEGDKAEKEMPSEHKAHQEAPAE